jgi:hypothetical protein
MIESSAISTMACQDPGSETISPIENVKNIATITLTSSPL